jgi:glycosyltransferase involved in cell wall biosynthesis
VFSTHPPAARAGAALADGVPLTPGDVPPEYRVRNVLDLPVAERSERVRLALQAMRPRRVEFPSAALAFRSVQARRAGLAFAETEFVVREGGRREVASMEDVEEHGYSRLWIHGPHTPYRPHTPHQASVTVCVPHFNHGPFLPEALASVAALDHPALDVIVIDDGSTDPASLRALTEMESRYPSFRFLRQANAGIGATRNRGLSLARGDFFLPLDADNILRPGMISKMLRAMRPELTALTCYFLAFERIEDIAVGRFLYACRPTGGPFALACHKNVYGDACALYRTDALRGAGGWAEDRGTSFEDWELFVKLAGSGHIIDVVPEHLFYYRHLATGFSRVTDQAANKRRVMRRFAEADGLPTHERQLVYEALAGLARADEARRGGGWRARMARWIMGGAG